jgi:DNA-binding transcriptional ArsR family regulator
MPAERITMRQVREIMRLLWVEKTPNREIARRLGLAPSTVRATLKRLAMAGLSWPLPEGLGDSELEERLYAKSGGKPGPQRLNGWIGPEAHFALKRLAKRYGVTQREMLERLIIAEHRRVLSEMDLDSPEWDAYLGD